MCNLSELIYDRGFAIGYWIRCVLDLLEEFGEIPDDIRDRIDAERDEEVLIKWYKAAARAENFDFDIFREVINQ